MLAHQTILAKAEIFIIIVIASCGLQQGGGLSPILWSLVADSLLKWFSKQGVFAEGYADDAKNNNLSESTAPAAHPWGSLFSHLGGTTSSQQAAQSQSTDSRSEASTEISRSDRTSVRSDEALRGILQSTTDGIVCKTPTDHSKSLQFYIIVCAACYMLLK